MTTKNFELCLTDEAEAQIQAIEADRSRQGLVKQLKKALKFLAANPNHPGLQSHPIAQFDKVFGGKVFSSYVQNNTPQAHRILWLYGPKAKQITIVAVTPHY
ncbi:MAG: hypothetical protein AABZ06_06795 [Bdellovibrionota bacterium]